MIKIISHGNIRRRTCPYCKCIFTFELEDIYKTRFDKENYFIECPDCEETIKVETEQIQDRVNEK